MAKRLLYFCFLLAPLWVQAQYAITSNSFVNGVGSGSDGTYTLASQVGPEGSFLLYSSPPPVINSFSPTSGNVGTTVTIAGINFDPTPANNIVIFGATAAVVNSATTTSLMVTVPAGAIYGPITVVNISTNLLASSFNRFTPTFSPSKGSITSADFDSKVDVASGNFPYYVAIGDLDGDGKADLAVANRSDNTVSVFRNTSSGSVSYATKIDFPTGTTPYSVAIGDVNGDGKADLGVANNGSNTASILINTSTIGTINFAAKVDVATGVAPRSVAFGDVDGDGKADLVVGNYTDNSISVFQNISSLGTASFATKLDFTTGSNPTSVAVVDLDGDGYLDLATANIGSNTVSALQNIGGGSINFAAKNDFTTGNSPQNVSVGDIDGDGKVDLVVANGGNSISVLLNTSSGTITFAAKADFTTGSNPYSVSIGDLDGDGKADLATANRSSNTVSTFRNSSTSGSVNFAAKVDLTTGTFPYSVAIGDVDGDGKPDLAVANGSSTTISIIRNNPVFSATISNFNPTSALQGTAIIITGTNFTGATAVTFGGVNAASYTVDSPTQITAYVGVGASGNVAVTTPSGSISVAGFTFIAPPTITSFIPNKGAVGTSVVITGTNFDPTATNNIVIFGATSATVSAATATSLTVTIPVGATYAPISVLNTTTGLLAYSNSNFTPTFTPNKGSITTADFNNELDVSGGNGSFSVAIGDLDGDGKADLAVASANGNKVSVYRNVSNSGSITSASFAAKVDFITGTAPWSVAIGDLDGDGKADLAVANESSSTVSVFRNTSSEGTITTASFAPKVDFGTGSGPNSVAIGDLDGDGKADLVVANNIGNTISILHNKSISGSITTASFASKVDFVTGSGPLAASIGDLDGDGKADLAIANNLSNSISVFHNASTSGSITSSSFAAKVDFTAISGPSSVAIGDLDEDGKADLVVSNNNSNTVSIYRNTSSSGSITTASFAPNVDFTTGANPSSVAIGDLDGDGKLDLAVNNNTGNSVSVYRNTSASGSITTASFAPKVDFNNGGYSFSFAIGDLDGDGKADLAVAAQNYGVMVLRNNPVFPTLDLAGLTSATPAVNAYSVRLLNSAYTGPLMRVTIGGSYYDVYPDVTSHQIALSSYVSVPHANYNDVFTGPDETLASVLGSNDATVAIWYDQSGNGHDVSQATTSLQPTLASGGVINLKNGVPTVYFNHQTLASSAFNNAYNSEFTLAMVAGVKNNLTNNTFVNKSFSNEASPFDIYNFNFWYGSATGAEGSGTESVTFNEGIYAGSGFSQWTFSSNGNGANSYINSVDKTVSEGISATIDDTPSTPLIFGSRQDGGTSLDGWISEFVSFNSVLTTDRTTLENNQIAYYSINGLPPTITSFSPLSSPAGAPITITGTNFSAIASNNAVYFGATKVNPANISGDANNLSVIVPTGATYAPISVTVNGSIAVSRERFNPTFNGGVLSSSSYNITSLNSTSHAYSPTENKDLDGDGKIDLVVVGDNGIAIYHNTSVVGATSYDAPVYIDNAQFFNAPVLEDLDGDGRIDIAISPSGNGLSIYKNQSTPGSISFGAGASIPAIPSVFAVGDLDGDGKLDIVSATSGFVTIYPNTSTGIGNFSFSTGPSFATFDSNSGFASIADFDGDGKNEVIVANPFATATNRLSVFLNQSTGAGNFSLGTHHEFSTGGLPQSIAVADFDGDGKLDLATANYSSNSVSVLKNISIASGSINFATTLDFATDSAPKSISVGDLNGDGKVDIATANLGSSNSSISLLGNTSSSGSISFNNKIDLAPTGAYPFGLSIADIDGDGKPDITTANNNGGNSNAVTIFRYIDAAPSITFSPSTGAVGDVITITAANATFDGNTTVDFGGTNAIVIKVDTPTQLRVNVPDLGTSPDPVYITVHLYGGPDITSANTFAVSVPALSITNFSPTSGYAGDVITITGTGFDSETISNNYVTFGNGETGATIISVSPDGTIMKVLAPGNSATSGYINVSNLSGSASSSSIPLTFAYLVTTPASNVGLYFDGTSLSYVESASLPITATDDFTISAWVKLKQSKAAVVVYNGNSSIDGYGIYVAPNNQVQALFGAIGTVSSDIYLNPNEWTYLTLTRNKGVIAILKNGTAGNFISGLPITTAPNPPTSFFRVGAGSTPSSDGFYGQIDEVRVYNASLSSSQIQVEMSSTSAGSTAAYWNFDEGNGYVANEYSGRLDAILNNNPLWAYHVTNTYDAGAGSLRDAIDKSNQTTDTNYIDFSLQQTDVNAVSVISPSSSLTVTQPLIVDGYSAFGSAPNTAAFLSPNNGKLRVELNLAAIPDPQSGLVVSTQNTLIQGLSVYGIGYGTGSRYNVAFFNASNSLLKGSYIGLRADGSAGGGLSGIGINESGENKIGGTLPSDFNVVSYHTSDGFYVIGSINNIIQGNYIGTDLSGNTNAGNGGSGISFNADSNRALGNLISGNTLAGITFEIGGDGYIMQGNYIGISADLLNPLSNGGEGIRIESEVINSTIGGTGAGEGNTIAYNGGFGISVTNPDVPPRGNKISGNKIYGNIGGGIFLGGSGANNDKAPPAITTANTISISGTAPNPTDIIEIFNDTPKTGNTNQGRTYLGTVAAVGGAWSFTGTFNLGDRITATATDISNNTSAFSNAVVVASPAPIITSFNPTSGPVGTPVLISGSNFNPTLNNNIVFFGGVQASIVSGGANSLTVNVPSGASYQYISVITNGLIAYSNLPFNVTFAGNPITAGSYSAQAPLTTGSKPYSTALGDLDGDGDLDIVAVNNSSNTVSVFKNTSSVGSVSYADTGLNLTTGPNPYGVALGDLNGDGKLDMVVTNDGGTSASIFRNTSSGAINFSADASVVTQSGPRGVAIADLDLDGKADLAITNYASNSISLFKNATTSTAIVFNPQTTISTGNGPNFIALNDFDTDGSIDIAITCETSNRAEVYEHGSNNYLIAYGSATLLNTGSAPRSIALGDFDNDGKIDISLSNYGSSSISTFKNVSTTGVSFSTKVDFNNGGFPNSTVVDLDGDGKIDIATVNYNSNTFAPLINNTSGTISFSNSPPTITFSTGNSPRAIAAGDLDLDGRPDIITVNETSNSLSIFRYLAFPPTINLTNTSLSVCQGSTTVNLPYSGTTNSPDKYSIDFQGAIGFVNVSNATLPSSPIIINLPATPGTYNANVTVYNSATSTVSVIYPITIVINPLPTVTITNPSAVCSPTTVDLTLSSVTAGSTAGLTFTYWTDAGATSSLSNPSSVTTSGTYYIKGTTAAGCFVIQPVSVTINPLPTVTITNPSAVCSPTTVDLTLSSVTAGSTAGLTFTYWNNAGATISLPNPSSVTTSGTYYIKGTTAAGCFVIQPVSVTINPLPTVTITNPSAVCSPTTVDLTLSSVTAGSTAGLTFTYWNNAGATISLPNPSSVTTSGTYYIKGTTAAGCFVIQPVSVTINPLPTVTITNPSAVCSPTTVDLTLSSVTAGSTAGLTFTYWNNAGATISLPNPSSVTASGTYYIKGTTAAGCFVIQPVAVIINALPTATITYSGSPYCASGTASVTQTGQAGGTYSSTGGLSINSATGLINLVSSTVGTYTVTYYFTNGTCANSTTTSVTINPLPSATITYLGSPYCATGTASVTQTGQAGGTYSSTGGLSINSATGLINLVSSTVGTYTVTYYFTNGTCANSTTTNVTITPLPNLVINNPSAVCSPTTVDLTLSSVTSGSAVGLTFTYWTDAGATSSLSNPSSVTTSGTYYIKGTTGAGCFVIQPVSVTINPLPTVTITNPSAVCSPTTVDLTLSSVTAGSTAGLTFTYWTDASATSSLSNPSSVTTSGTYYIKGTTGAGCFVIQPVSVTINPLPTVTINDPSAVCSPGTVDLTSTSVTAGSTVGLTFTYWTDAGATSSLSNPSSVTTSGTYYIKGTTGAGCFVIQPVSVTINPLPTVTINDPSAVCSPGTVDLTSTSVTAGSTVGLTFTYWTDAGAISSLSNPSSVATSGTYYIKGTTGAGCFVIQPVSVTINPLPTVTITDPSAVCSPGTVNLTSTSVTAGSTAGLTFTYWTDAGATSSLSNPSSVAASGTYYIKGTTGAGCFVIQPVSVTINPLPTVTITDPSAVCSPGTVDLTSTSVTSGSTVGLTFTYWTDTGATSSLSNPSSVTTSGTYYIKGTTGNCFVTKKVNVTIKPSPVLDNNTPQTICSGSMFNYTATSLAGSTFTWVRKSITGINEPSTSGFNEVVNETLTNSTSQPIQVTYSFTTSLNGCSGSSDMVVSVNPLPIGISQSVAVASGTPINVILKYASTGATPDSYSITTSPATGLTGNVIEAQYLLRTATNTTAISNDTWVNTFRDSNGFPVNLNVIYTITPTLTYQILDKVNTTNFTNLVCAGKSYQVTTTILSDGTDLTNLLITVANPDKGANADTPASANNGIDTDTNFFSGAKSKVILGTTFSATNAGTAFGSPKLIGFSIKFDKSILTVYQNPRIYQSTNDNQLDATDVTGIATITLAENNQQYDVTLKSPFDLTSNLKPTFFLMADVSASASVASGRITATLSLKDVQGTIDNLASSSGQIVGRTYGFIDITPPQVVSLLPVKNSKNFSGNVINIEFNKPVTFTATGAIQLYNIDGTLFDQLTDYTITTNPEVTSNTIFNFKLHDNKPLTDITYYYLTIPSNTFVDNSGNQFAGFSKSTDWRFRTIDRVAPKFVFRDSLDLQHPKLTTQILDITLLGGNIQTSLDKIGNVNYFITPSPSTRPTVDQIFDPSTYSGSVAYKDTVFVLQDSVVQYGSANVNPYLIDNTTYDIWLAATNDAGVRSDDAQIQKLTFLAKDPPPGPFDPLITSALRVTQLCYGDYQTLAYPITITERGSADFYNGGNATQTIGLLLPTGYEFNINAPKDTVIATGADIKIKMISYPNNSLIKIDYVVSDYKTRDKIVIQGLQMKAVSSTVAQGNILRLGGNGLKQIQDFSKLATISVVKIPSIDFDFIDTSDGTSKVVLTDVVSNATTTLALSAHINVKDPGDNVFSGKGVFNDELDTRSIGIDTTTVFLLHTNQYGCSAQTSKTLTIYDKDNAIHGLSTIYNVYPKDGSTVPKGVIDRSGNGSSYTLKNVTIATPSDNPYAVDASKSLIFDLDATGQLMDIIFNPQLVVYDGAKVSAALNPDGTKLFDNKGGKLIDLTFTATYTNSVTSNDDPFTQVVQLYIPPKASFNSDFSALTKVCENAGDLIVSGAPLPEAGKSVGYFRINGSKKYLLDGNNGTATLRLDSMGMAGYTNYAVRYVYEILATGGTDSVEHVINVVPKPRNPKISYSLPCVNTPVNFVGSATIDASDKIASYQYILFDDFAAQAKQVKTGQNITYTFTNDGVYNVDFYALSQSGCVSDTLSSSVKISGIPTARFNLVGLAKGDKILFTSSSSVSTDKLGSLDWTFGDNAIGSAKTTLHSSLDTVSYVYQNAGVYRAKLKVTGVLGCSDTTSVVVGITPKIQVITSSFDNFEDTTNNGGGWMVLNKSQNSWRWIPSNVDTKNNSTLIWKTDASGFYVPNERAYVYSPVYDISKLSRPMVSFNSYYQFEKEDGVVLQFSTDTFNIADSRKKWITLGKYDESTPSGLGWFSAKGLRSKPGDQSVFYYGWTNEINGWQESKHSLASIASAYRKTVIFRFALASVNGTITKAGFAFDNFRLGNRTRTVLLESFVNVGNGNAIEKIESDSIRDSKLPAGLDLAKINYHVGFPGIDPFNLDNPTDVGARALFYDITSTPLARLDGKNRYDQAPKESAFINWKNKLALQQLELAKADIQFKTTSTKDGITISGTVTAQGTTLTKDSVSLWVAILEGSTTSSDLTTDKSKLINSGETNFEYIFKKLLPTASGVKLSKDLPDGATDSFGPFTWSTDKAKSYAPKNDFAVVVFLQRVDTKEVYQSALATGINDPDVLTGIEGITSDEVTLFPNPANKEVTIQLPGVTTKAIDVSLFDQFGRVVSRTTISEGQSSKSIPTEDLPSGVYIIQLGSGDQQIKKKIMVIHPE